MTPTPDTLDAAPGLWLTISALAAQKGLTKQSVAERVARLEGQGLLTTRPGKGRTKLVNLAEFDRAAGQVADLSREQGAATRKLAEVELVAPPAADGSPSYTREQARNMAYRADLAKLELDERRGALMRRDKVRDAAKRAMATIVNRLEGISAWSDDLAIALAKDGPHGVRLLLKARVLALRTQIARDFEAMAAAAPEFDPSFEEEAEA